MLFRQPNEFTDEGACLDCFTTAFIRAVSSGVNPSYPRFCPARSNCDLAIKFTCSAFLISGTVILFFSLLIPVSCWILGTFCLQFVHCIVSINIFIVRFCICYFRRFVFLQNSIEQKFACFRRRLPSFLSVLVIQIS